jgi:hypothetical protein
MKKYQKNAFFRICSPIIIFIAIIGCIFLYQKYTHIVEDLMLWLLQLLLGGLVGGLIGCFLFEIIAGRILDYQISKQLDEDLFYLYMERRKMTRSDVSYDNCIGISETKQLKILNITETLETYLTEHKILRFYYRTFLMHCFIVC